VRKGNILPLSRVASEVLSRAWLSQQRYFHVAVQTVLPVAVKDRSRTGLRLSSSRRVCLSIPTSLCQCATNFIPFTAISRFHPSPAAHPSRKLFYPHTYLHFVYTTCFTHSLYTPMYFTYMYFTHTHIYTIKFIPACALGFKSCVIGELCYSTNCRTCPQMRLSLCLHGLEKYLPDFRPINLFR